MLNYNHLYYFYIAATAGSITAAAKRLRVAQPSLSSQIKVLEHSLGKKLFERDGRGIKLSPDGQIVFGHCRKIFEAADELEALISTGKPDAARIHMGVSTDVERPFLVDIVSRLHRSAGRAKPPLITMSSATQEQLISRVKTGALDAFISNEPILDSDLLPIASARLPVVLAFKGDGRFKDIAHVRLGHLRTFIKESKIVWALPQRSMRLRRETDLYFEKSRIEPQIAFESDILATIVRAVSDDVGVALLPLPFLGAYSKRLNWIAPPEGFWKHSISLVAPRKTAGSKILNQLKQAFNSTMRAELN